MERIYLDNNATTPLDPRVFKAMMTELTGPPANPSSLHWFGQRARSLLQKARQKLASFFKVTPEEILFTSGGTESINLLLRGYCNKGHIISTTIEHSCVYRTLQSLEAKGISVTYLPVGSWGAPLAEQITSAIRPDTRAMVFSASNTETGVKIDLEKIASIASSHAIPLFIDAVAMIGKESFSLYPGITAVALSGHKFHAPKGTGALFLRSSCKLDPLFTGGAQEQMRRAGTENLAGIIGLGEAIDILQERQSEITQQIDRLRLYFEQELKRITPNLVINGEGPRTSNTSNIAFLGTDGETFLMQLDMAGIAVSHGSACSSGAIEPSRVLTQMGIDRKTARCSIRFSFSRMNTQQEIDLALDKIAKLLSR